MLEYMAISLSIFYACHVLVFNQDQVICDQVMLSTMVIRILKDNIFQIGYHYYSDERYVG